MKNQLIRRQINMHRMTDTQDQITIAANTRQGLDALRSLVDELEDGTVLSLDLTEVITDGQEDG